MVLRLVSILSITVVAAVTVCFGAESAPIGKATFDAHCAICHSIRGDGQSADAARFFTRPADLTRGSFKFRSTPSGSLPTDQDLERTIRHGLPGSGMVAQDHLSDVQIGEVIAYLKTLSPRWSDAATPQPIAIVPPANLDSLAARGAELFPKAGCPECHGESGRGDGPSAARLTSGGQPTRPADLTRRPLKGGDRAEDIFRALATGLDGTPMPSYRDALEENEIWALAVYVTRLAMSTAKPLLTDDERIGHEVETMHQPGRRR